MNDSAVSRNLFYKISMCHTMRQTVTSHYVIALSRICEVREIKTRNFCEKYDCLS